MTTVSVTVTAEHIARGVREDCERCPIALAILDAILDDLPDADYIAVGSDTCTIGTRDGSDTDVDLPWDVLYFITDFDSARPVEPFSFTIDYPAVTR